MTSPPAVPLEIPFNIIDEAFTHADDPSEPMTVHIEVQAVGALDADRLRDAVAVAIGRHPLARARMEPWVEGVDSYRWLVDDTPQVDPFRSMIGTGATLDDIRGDFYSRPLSLFESPPLRVLHVVVDDGDVVMLSVHHSASDGIGALRLLRSICLAYSGLDDPKPDLDPAEARRLAVPAEAPSVAEQIHSGQMEMARMAQLGSFPSRLTPEGQMARPGYGVTTISVPLGPLLGSSLRASTGATVNDVLIAAASLAAARWISSRAAASGGVDDGGRIVIQMPINARPAAWSRDVVANLVTADSVSTTALERSTAESCLAAVSGWTAAVKQRGPGPALAALAAVPDSGAAMRRSAAGWVKQVGAAMADTLVLSNLGRVPDDELGMDLQAMFFSPPGPMPQGLGLGAVAFGDRLHLTFRHRWELWSAAACREFADLFVTVLDELGAD